MAHDSQRIKAARFHAALDIRLESIAPPPPRHDEVLVDVAWAGICGTDMHEYLAGPAVINTAARPHRLTGAHLPVTMGHEFTGHVSSAVRVPADSPLQPGDAVIVDPRLNCKTCTPCHRGQANVCASWGFLGLNGRAGAGAFADSVAVEAAMCHRLPHDARLDHAALIEPLAVARHALAVSSVSASGWRDCSVLVIGGGPVGFAVLCNLAAAGVGVVYVSEPAAQRREQTRPWATDVFDPTHTAVAEECRRLTDGNGVDVVFDCAGVTAAMKEGMRALRAKGVYVNVAGWETDFTPSINLMMARELTLKTSMAYDDKDFADVVRDFIAGKFKGAEAMITARIALDDLVPKGFEQLANRKDQHVKILATPRGELLDSGGV